MEPGRQKLFARLGLVAFVAVCAVWLGRLDYAQKISTNVLELLPPAEQSPEAALVRNLAGDSQAKVMLFVLRDPARPEVAPVDAGKQFAAELARSPTFAEAVSIEDDDATKRIGRVLFEQRFTLLLPSWLAERRAEFERAAPGGKTFSSWLAERVAADLETFLARPEAVPMQELISTDPLLLLPEFIARAQDLAPKGSGTSGRTLVWARIKASPLAEEGQGPVFAAVNAALRRTRADHPGVELQWSGVNRFAAASRARIESEVSVLNAVSILGVLAVGCLFVRRVWQMLHLVPVILLSLLGAWTVATIAFERLHILVFVIGSLLSGVAIDYGFYIYMQPSLTTAETYGEKLRRLLKPLLASCLTTVIGFSLLLFSELPLLREVGLFVAAGLICALGGAMLYFAQLDRPFLAAREFGRSGNVSAWVPRLLLVFAAVVVVAGPWRLRWRDDVRQLEIPSPELQANDHELRTWFGDTADQSVFLTHGATVSEAREHLEAFLGYAKRVAPQAKAASLGLAFPTETNWRALPGRLDELKSFEADFRAALVRHGFTVESFEGFFTAWNARPSGPVGGNYEKLYTDFSRELTGPLAMLFQAQGPMSWFLTIVTQPNLPAPPPELSTVGINQLESLNALFTRYRWSGLRLSLAGLALVIASVFAIYRGRSAVRIALIPAGSCFFVFGLFGAFGATLNLFHLLGAFLGVCLSHNYAIFSAETAGANRGPPVSIRLSALSTATSFGVLAFSRIPVIHALGLTVALIVLTALATVELEPFARRRTV